VETKEQRVANFWKVGDSALFFGGMQDARDRTYRMGRRDAWGLLGGASEGSSEQAPYLELPKYTAAEGLALTRGSTR